MTDKKIAEILGDMVVVCDNREKRWIHIKDYLDQNKIPYIMDKLVSADYTVRFPNNPSFNECVLVERKHEWTELCGNFTSKREQFVNEFERIPDGTITHLVIEDATWFKLFNGSYRSQLPPKSLLASVLTFNIRYNIHVWTVTERESPELIYNLLWYGVRETLKQIQKKT